MQLRTVDLDVVGRRAGAMFAEAVAGGDYKRADLWLIWVFALLEPAREEGGR